jgi:hypothetical protein
MEETFMKRWLKIVFICIGVILIVAVGASAWLLNKALPIGAGFTAKYLCSSTFISQRNPEIVFREDFAPINPLFKNVDWRVDREEKSVSADYFGLFTTTAIYREGCGCSLVLGTSAEGFHKDMPLLGWSMSKSVTHALVGIQVRNRQLNIKLPAPVSEWQQEGDLRGKITIDQQLRMCDGLEFEEIYAPFRDVTYMLYDSYDYAAYAATKPSAVEPDTKWNYSSGTANIIACIVRQTAEKSQTKYYSLSFRPKSWYWSDSVPPPIVKPGIQTS